MRRDSLILLFLKLTTRLSASPAFLFGKRMERFLVAFAKNDFELVGIRKNAAAGMSSACYQSRTQLGRGGVIAESLTVVEN